MERMERLVTQHEFIFVLQMFLAYNFLWDACPAPQPWTKSDALVLMDEEIERYLHNDIARDQGCLPDQVRLGPFTLAMWGSTSGACSGFCLPCLTPTQHCAPQVAVRCAHLLC